jgi:hypothetical protein
MGVSYDGAQSSICASEIQLNTANCSVNFTTGTVPDGLYTAGYIKSRSYSLYLDDVAAKSGSILFGGIDTTKFTGELVTLGVPPNTRPHNTNDGIWAYQDQYLTSGKSFVIYHIHLRHQLVTPNNFSVW